METVAQTGPSWITISLLVINGLIGMLLALISWLMARWYTKLDSVSQQLVDFQLSVTANTVPRETFEKDKEYTRGRVHGLADRMTTMEGRISAVEGAFRIIHHIKWPLPEGKDG